MIFGRWEHPPWAGSKNRGGEVRGRQVPGSTTCQAELKPYRDCGQAEANTPSSGQPCSKNVDGTQDKAYLKRYRWRGSRATLYSVPANVHALPEDREEFKMDGSFHHLRFSIALILLFSAGASASCAAETVPDCGGLSVRFNFNEDVGGNAYPGVPAHQQVEFKKNFCDAVTAVTNWFIDKSWLVAGSSPFPSSPTVGSYRPTSQLQIYVGIQYDISQSLVPAWMGQRGRMQFPSVEAVAGQSAAVHELTHVFFPNGNRMLAEGLAVYLQQAYVAKAGQAPQPIDTNPAFPNYGDDLHLVAYQYTSCLSARTFINIRLDQIDLASVDKIATPNELRLRAGRQLNALSNPNYVVAGSFIRFLIESYGDHSETADTRMKKFRELYLTTPLVPFEREPGKADRWSETYGIPLLTLQDQWKQYLKDHYSHSNCGE